MMDRVVETVQAGVLYSRAGVPGRQAQLHVSFMWGFLLTWRLCAHASHVGTWYSAELGSCVWGEADSTSASDGGRHECHWGLARAAMQVLSLGGSGG